MKYVMVSDIAWWIPDWEGCMDEVILPEYVIFAQGSGEGGRHRNRLIGEREKLEKVAYGSEWWRLISDMKKIVDRERLHPYPMEDLLRDTAIIYEYYLDAETISEVLSDEFGWIHNGFSWVSSVWSTLPYPHNTKRSVVVERTLKEVK